VVLGGAPFNVAWHLQGFGLNPLLISRIGRDDLGTSLRASMEDWGMDTGGLQYDPQSPTGKVEVHMQDGEPRFEILPRQAYDFIDALEAWSVLKKSTFSLLYHGTLAARHSVSRTALHELVRKSGLPVFIDVNLRPPWWEQSTVARLGKEALWLKMNEKELALLTGAKAPLRQEEEESVARQLLQKYGLAMLILTLGAQGALLLTEEEGYRSGVPPVEEVVDPVGAGDAFSAVCILGLLKEWDPSLILERSLEFSARIVTRRGAISPDPQLYKYFSGRWNL
jgi:fructokinase